IGADLGFLDNRINVTADWYKRNNYDLIGIITTQGLGGEIEKYGNVASMKSSGFELSISTRNIVTKDFTWSTDFIYSHNKNEVTELQAGKKRVIDL
ncbi:TonB-dependent receptor, partial [Parabacteroides distasonis]|uniref:TonB-dependent receptor n=1 Tax=Parabacteroides distasonis TaxID=823 RepID=UPI002109D019